MNLFLSKTFGGLTKSFYLRHLFFGTFFGSIILYKAFQTSNVKIGAVALVSTILYPYSRFLYETIIDFILGNNQFSIPALIYLYFKLVTMLLCWAFAIFIAPLGLLFLYIHHTRQLKIYEREFEQQGVTE